MPRNIYLLQQSLPLAQARCIVDGAILYAGGQDMNPITVTVVDLSGEPIASDRMDGCAPLRVAVSRGKAKAALGYGLSSGVIGERNDSRPAFLASVAAAAGGEFIPVAGGVLILNERDEVIGAVGVSGDSSHNDECAALAGIKSSALKAGIEP
ncbi:GlcG/HbpS family heme-binding protein [Salinicola halophilus]|uniref:GlcG/HbpS family heme-binding protein n=1 Tax=Salinicola halophilus TaxID=184065 RepID=UPI000DA25B0A|nr:heme-binding protein [Salinicola halophilus]